MQSGHSRHKRPFSQEGSFNPQLDNSPQHPYRFYVRAEPVSNKRTPTTKHSLDKHHNSSKILHKKREITHDVSTHFTQNMRERRIRSHSKNRTEISDSQENGYGQHFGRITMHCLRKRREHFQKDAHSLQSQYSYILKKIEKLQKEKETEHYKQQRKQLIQFKRKKELSSLLNIKASNDSLIMRRKEELKEQVLSHRANKTHNVIAVKQEKLRAGDQQRMKESHLHEELIYIHQSRVQQNKIKCQRGKAEKIRRQRRMRSELEEKRIAARENFRHRWIDQYQRQQAAKQEYRIKKEEFQRKIKEAIDYCKEIEGQ